MRPIPGLTSHIARFLFLLPLVLAAGLLHPIVAAAQATSNVLGELRAEGWSSPAEAQTFRVGKTLRPVVRGPAKSVPNRPAFTDSSGGPTISSSKPALSPAVASSVPTIWKNFNGAAKGDLAPGDTNGAVNGTYLVETTNSALDIFAKSNGAHTSSVPLNTFWNFPERTGCLLSCEIFDPRVVYDERFGRFIMSAEAHHETASVQRWFLAVSKTSDPTGEWWIWSFDMDRSNNGNFYDFPQLGYNSTSIVATMNVFASESSNTWVGQKVWGWPKSQAYAGLSLTLNRFNLPISNYCCTVAPSITTKNDTNTAAYLLQAPSQGSTVRLWRAIGLGTANQTLVVQANVAVGTFSYSTTQVAQPGTTFTLDPGDARFEHDGVQSGQSLWQIHTVNLGGFPAPRFYQINTGTNQVYQSGYVFRSQTSYDFHPSIVANNSGEAFVTWTATDPANGINPEMRISGRKPTDLLGAIGPGKRLVLSNSYYTGGHHWGDYSSVSLDPSAYTACGGVSDRRVWVVGMDAINPSTWGSRFGEIGYC
jgi:hypothetical protein